MVQCWPLGPGYGPFDTPALLAAVAGAICRVLHTLQAHFWQTHSSLGRRHLFVHYGA